MKSPKGCRYLAQITLSQIEAELIAARLAFSVTRKTCTPTKKLRRSKKTDAYLLGNIRILRSFQFHCQALAHACLLDGARPAL